MVTANVAVTHWLAEVANEHVHGATEVKPNIRLKEERPHLQPIPSPWRAFGVGNTGTIYAC